MILSGCAYGPEIDISGVEEGKVYTGQRTISINEELAGTYSMKLNGKSIKTGHVVKGNGTYQLSITSKKLTIEKEKEINFTIDDQPPKYPTFKDEIQPGYFGKVKLELNKEDGVTYSTKLNGKPYDLTVPIEEEGSYELDILAKKENGKVSHRTDSFIVDNQTFTQEMIDDFLTFHLEQEDGIEEEPFILKWIGETVPVYVHGAPTDEDLTQIHSYFNELNAWLPVQFDVYGEKEINFTDYQIDMYFVPNEEFQEYGFTDELIKGSVETIGFAQVTDGNSVDGLLSTTIGIDSTIPQALRNPTILHEIVHSLGMYNHFENDTSSILYPLSNQKVTALNETDRKYIDMLYRKDLLAGMTEKDIRDLWKTRVVK
jgi:hypothetical protein